MKKYDKVKNFVSSIGKKSLFFLFFALICVSALLAFNFHELYSARRDNLLLHGQLGTHRLADDFSIFLEPNVSELKTSTFIVEHIMQQDNYSPDEVKKFLTMETNVFSKTIDGSFSGLYGYFNGDYIDGTDWVPDEDFNPVERPWYLSAMVHPDRIAFVDPYLDALSGSILMTVSKTLDDGKSVLAIDITLDYIQNRVEQLSRMDGAVHMIVNSKGLVIAHSDKSQVGKRYSGEDNVYAYVAQRLQTVNAREIKGRIVEFAGANYVVYAREIDSSWYSVSIMDADDFFRSLHIILVASITSVVLVLLSIVVGFLRMARKQIRIEKLNENMKLVASVYDRMYEILLPEDVYRIINRERETAGSVVGVARSGAQNFILRELEALADEVSLEDVKSFADLSTIGARLEESVSVSQEFLSRDGMWYRARFIRTEGLHYGRVMLLTENIDHEKRRRDRLQYLSETDHLTSISNRRSGEAKIAKILAHGGCGMFVLLDADRFKSVNDNYGHDVGDKVIVAIADCMKESFRSGDVLMRLGGLLFTPPGTTSPDGHSTSQYTSHATTLSTTLKYPKNVIQGSNLKNNL